MSFWAEKIAESLPQQVNPKAMAPGAWWQPASGKSARTQRPAAATPPSHEQAYAPTQARSIEKTEQCPRCGSDEYAEVVTDASYGGRGMTAKMCFACRYPNINPSGEIVRGGVRPGSEVTTHRVRQAQGGSWRGAATFDAAPLVV